MCEALSLRVFCAFEGAPGLAKQTYKKKHNNPQKQWLNPAAPATAAAAPAAAPLAAADAPAKASSATADIAKAAAIAGVRASRVFEKKKHKQEYKKKNINKKKYEEDPTSESFVIFTAKPSREVGGNFAGMSK